MKTRNCILSIVALLVAVMPLQAQLGGSLQRAKGTTYYVSASGSTRADGRSASTPKKDLQTVLNLIRDNHEDGAVIRIAEGNYLGALNAGYIEVYNFVTLEGGWNSSFTHRDPMKYITRIEPGQEQLATNSRAALIQINKALDDATARHAKGALVIDGLCLNFGYENAYKPADPSDPRNGCPSKAFETGRMEDATPPQVNHSAIHSDGWIAGNVTIRNCVIANSPYFGIQINSRCGKVVIANNVFIANRYSAVRVGAGDKEGKASHVIFHHNTVAFSWCRDKEMDDMGYGYECMTKINCDIHHNIFACNNYAAIARTHVLSGPDKTIEARRVTDIHDNAFFMNPADLQLPAAGGGKWTNVKAAQFEELDETVVPKAGGNYELSQGDAFVSALDKDYLEAFAKLKPVRSSSFDAGSAANHYRDAHGLNKQGTETLRVSMYGNRYSLDKALKLFGAKAGYGAQRL